MPRAHYHRGYEVYCLTQGRRRHLIEAQVYDTQPGDIVLIPPYTFHRTIDLDDASHDRILLQFEPDVVLLSHCGTLDLLQCFQLESPVLRLRNEQQQTIEAILRHMAAEYASRSRGWEGMLQALLLQFLLQMNRLFPISFLASASSQTALMHRVACYLRASFRDRLGLAAIARHFHVSPCYLSDTFHRKMGFSIVEYVNQLRIKEALERLSTSEDSIITVSQKVGFGSISHFNAMFKRVVGMSPRQFRAVGELPWAVHGVHRAPAKSTHFPAVAQVHQAEN